jgi:hypothetical protein
MCGLTDTEREIAGVAVDAGEVLPRLNPFLGAFKAARVEDIRVRVDPTVRVVRSGRYADYGASGDVCAVAERVRFECQTPCRHYQRGQRGHVFIIMIRTSRDSIKPHVLTHVGFELVHLLQRSLTDVLVCENCLNLLTQRRDQLGLGRECVDRMRPGGRRRVDGSKVYLHQPEDELVGASAAEPRLRDDAPTS